MFECFIALKLAEYWCVFFCLLCLHVVVLLVLKMLVAGKQKYTHKTLRKKCQALKDLEKGESNKDVAIMKSDNYELVSQAIFNWFLIMRSQNVPLSASMVQKKQGFFAEEWNTETFQASDGWLQR